MQPDAVLGNIQLFLIQMLVLFIGSQAVTEIIKQKVYRKQLVEAKLRPEKLAAASEDEVKAEMKRQATVRNIACLVGIFLAWAAQINPLQTLSPVLLWDAARSAMVAAHAPALLTRIVVDIVYAFNFTLVGALAIYGAPLFNDLLNLVMSARAKAVDLKRIAKATPGHFPPIAEEMLTEALMANTTPPLSESAARAKVREALGAAAAALQPPERP